MHAHNGMNAFYGILSDISLATVGVFVLMFVILIVISNRDVAQLMAENGRMVAAARSVEEAVQRRVVDARCPGHFMRRRPAVLEIPA